MTHHSRPRREERFPQIWVPDPGACDLRALVAHRMRLVRIRTMLKNGVHAIAMSYRLALGRSLFTQGGLAQLRALPLAPHTARRRDESLDLLGWLDPQIDQLEQRRAEAAHADAQACRLMTHPGVGPLTALATLLVLGPVERFPTSKHVVSYVGLAPAIASSAGKHHVGRITKQGNPNGAAPPGTSGSERRPARCGLEAPLRTRAPAGGGHKR